MKLLPCPYCGASGKPYHVTHFTRERNERLGMRGGTDARSIVCGRCWMRGPVQPTKQGATRSWNRVARAMQKEKKK